MTENRREFLKKSLKVGTVATAVAASGALGSQKVASEPDSNGVVKGKSNKKEVLYSKSEAWEKFYKVAY